MQKRNEAYKKMISGEEYYIVKQFLTFPDSDIPDILQNMGMHSDLRKACRIAKLNPMDTEKLCTKYYYQKVKVHTEMHTNPPRYSPSKWMGYFNFGKLLSLLRPHSYS
jgi:hypothetical protein